MCNSNTWEAEPEGSPQVQCQPGALSEFQAYGEILSQEKKMKMNVFSNNSRANPEKTQAKLTERGFSERCTKKQALFTRSQKLLKKSKKPLRAFGHPENDLK